MKRDFARLSVITALFLSSTLAFAQTTEPTVDADGEVVKTVNCAAYSRQTVKVDGGTEQRFVVSDGGYLKCLKGQQPLAPWTVSKAYWSTQDESNWRNFVYSIGKAVESGKCNTVDTCLASSANPYRGDVEMSGTFYADCADFPMYLRTYFAYKNNLPMSFGINLMANAPTQSQIDDAVARVSSAERALTKAETAKDSTPETIAKRELELKTAKDALDDLSNTKDTRYSRNGNYFGSRMNVPSSKTGITRDFFSVADLIHDNVSSGSYRMLFNPAGKTLPDFYSAKISRDSITAGSVAYKPTGHVALVFEVTAKGDVRMVDAHPDNSLTVLSFSNEFMRSLPQHAAGFKNFRPFQVMSPVYDQSNTTILSGTIGQNTDSQLANFSLEQYFGNAPVNNTDSRNAKWVAKGQAVDFFEYVRIKLASGNFKEDPIHQFRQDLRDLCLDLQGRTEAVQIALRQEMQMKDHPEALPRNIYGADGEWEAYSTPGRDLRIRQRVRTIIENSKKYMGKLASRDQFFDYQGSAAQLKADLIRAYNEENATCEVTYNNTSGNKVSLGLGTALKRITKMSFDPYFCPERRWGATYRTELVTCADSTEKSEWYRFQQFLRNATERDPNEIMGWTLQDLRNLEKRGAVDSGDHSADYDILNKLKSL
jgi:hypothetical protein